MYVNVCNFEQNLMELDNDIYVVMAPCKLRNCKLDIGVLIVLPNAVNGFNGEDVFLVDNIPVDQKDFHFKGKVLPSDNTVDDIKCLKDVQFDLNKDRYKEPKLKFDLLSDVYMDCNLSVDILRLYTGKENISHVFNSFQDTNLYRGASFCSIDKSLAIATEYIPVDSVKGLYLKRNSDNQELCWLTKDDVKDIDANSVYGIITPEHGIEDGFCAYDKYIGTLSFIQNLQRDRVYGNSSEPEFRYVNYMESRFLISSWFGNYGDTMDILNNYKDVYSKIDGDVMQHDELFTDCFEVGNFYNHKQPYMSKHINHISNYHTFKSECEIEEPVVNESDSKDAIVLE